MEVYIIENVSDIAFFILWKYIFLWFYQSVEFEGNVIYSTLKKSITSAMVCIDSAAFAFATIHVHCILHVDYAYLESLFIRSYGHQIY